MNMKPWRTYWILVGYIHLHSTPKEFSGTSSFRLSILIRYRISLLVNMICDVLFFIMSTLVDIWIKPFKGLNGPTVNRTRVSSLQTKCSTIGLWAQIKLLMTLTQVT